jgi:hypothetical protein
VIQKKVELKRSLKWVSYKHQVFLLPCSVRCFSEKVLLHDQNLNHTTFEIFAYFCMNFLLQFIRLLLSSGLMLRRLQLGADSHYTSRFRSVTVPSSFRQIGLCGVHTIPVQTPFRTARSRRFAIFSIKYAASFVF